MMQKFVSICPKKTQLVAQYLGTQAVQDVISLNALDLKDKHISVRGAWHEVLSTMKSQIELWLHAARKLSAGDLWTVYTLIGARRQYAHGSESLEDCTRIVQSWSGCTHTVYTMMAELNAQDKLRYKVSTTKVKCKRIQAAAAPILAEALHQASLSGGYLSISCIGQHIRHMAGPVGGCEGVPILPLVHFLRY